MLQCWEFEPKRRPTFCNLVQSLSQSLEAMAGYMDIGAFGGIVPNPSGTVTSNSRSGVSDVPVGHDSLEEEPSKSKVSESQEEFMMGTICDETRV